MIGCDAGPVDIDRNRRSLNPTARQVDRRKSENFTQNLRGGMGGEISTKFARGYSAISGARFLAPRGGPGTLHGASKQQTNKRGAWRDLIISSVRIVISCPGYNGEQQWLTICAEG